MFKKIYFTILLSGLTLFGMAQSELSPYFLNNVGAAHYLNPANNPEAKLSWSLPSFYYFAGNEGPSIYASLKDAVFNLDGIKGELKDNNSLNYAAQGSLYQFSYNTGKYNFHIGQNLKINSQLDYNYALFDLILHGNAQYIGETVNIGPYFNVMHYNELYFGMGMTYDNYKFGARIKRLNGYNHAETENSEFSLHTDEEIYQLTVNTDYRIKTNIYPIKYTPSAYIDRMLGNLFGNGGWAFDLGFSADILEDFTVSASVLDIGSIKWKNNATIVSSTGEFKFEGLDINDLFADEGGDGINIDSLWNDVDFNEVNESYTTSLPTQLYLGLQYRITEKWDMNALFYNAFSPGRSHVSTSIMGKYKPSKYFHTSLNYTWNNYSNFNFGWGNEVHLKWFHAYITTDNILDLFRPVSANFFNVRVGMQIDLIGKKD